MFCKILILALAALSWASPQTIEAPKKETPRLVKMYKVGKPRSEYSFSYPAVIDAAVTAKLSFQTAGKIEKLPIKESQVVKKGQLIAQLDQVILKNNVSSTHSSYKNAKADYERALRLIKQNAISKKELDQRRTEKNVSFDKWKSAKKALKDSKILAPFDGVVSLKPVKVSQTVQATETVAVLIEKGKMDAITNIPAKIIANVKRKEGAQATVILDAAPNSKIRGVFREASLQADNVTQTYEVSFRFQPPGDLVILPGMNARVIIHSRQNSEFMAKSEVTVPMHSIFTEGDKKYVWLVDPKNKKVKKTEIAVAKSIGEFITVKSGLNDGDIVVGAGASYLSDGMTVKSWSKASSTQ